MRTLYAITVLLFSSAAVAQPDEVAVIDEYVNTISIMIEDVELVERHMSYTHTTVPGIGMPSNEITGYFKQYYTEEDWESFEEVPVLIENVYFHAGYDAEERYYYTLEGELVCCISSHCESLEEGQRYTDCFYFSGGKAIYYKSGTGETFETLDEEAAELATGRLANAERLKGLFMELTVPAPCIFWERWRTFDN
jgi:hypothetical protein